MADPQDEVPDEPPATVALGSALSLMLLAVLGALVMIYNRYLGMAQLMKGLG